MNVTETQCISVVRDTSWGRLHYLSCGRRGNDGHN